MSAVLCSQLCSPAAPAAPSPCSEHAAAPACCSPRDGLGRLLSDPAMGTRAPLPTSRPQHLPSSHCVFPMALEDLGELSGGLQHRASCFAGRTARHKGQVACTSTHFGTGTEPKPPPPAGDKTPSAESHRAGLHHNSLHCLKPNRHLKGLLTSSCVQPNFLCATVCLIAEILIYSCRAQTQLEG